MVVSNLDIWRTALILIVLALAACANPVAEQAKQAEAAARFAIQTDAIAYYSCSHRPVAMAGECRPLYEKYKQDYANFVAKYGAPDESSAACQAMHIKPAGCSPAP